MIIEEKNIIDEYRILKKKIGEGTWGTVHLAEDAEGSKVALKFLDGKKLLKECGLVDDQATLHFFKEKKGAFKEEYKNLKKLLHPNVAGAYRLGYFNEELYIASEYIDGKSLYEATRGMKPEDMIPLFLQGLLGLEAIHRHGLLHLDIKSGNVLLSKSGNVKIIDFGFSTLMEALKISICGSLPYMAPEVLFQKREFVGAQSDLYSFGCMMYRCLTGAYPYPQREHMEFDVESAKDVVKKEARPVPPSQMHIKVPKYLDQIILRLIVNDYHGRFYGGNVRAVINALATKQPENFREGVASRAAYLIPAGDEHIGRDEVKKILFKSVDDLRKGVQPAAPIFIISGEKGIGKTHLLQKVVNYAGEHVEETGICYLSLPTDDDRIEDWINKVNLEIGSAMRPVILTIDNAQYLLSEEGPAFKKAAGVLNNILDLLTERIKSSSLLAGVPPIIAILTLSENSYDKFKGQFNCFQLKRFTKEQIKTYLEKTPAFKNTDIPEKWVDTLLTSTDGVPGRLADRLRSYDSHGLFMELDTDMHLISENVIMPGERDLPSSIEEHLDRIYDNLSVYEKEVIDLISVWSFKDLTDAPKFADIYRYCSRLNLGQILNGLIKKNIIRLDPKSSSYLFYDEAFARRHFYEKIDVKRRMGIHGTIAANMEKYSDAYLVHHGMAGNSITNIVSIIRLGERLMCKEGKIQTARELFLHACENTSDMSNNLPSYINYLISKTCFLNGEFSRAIKYCEDGLNLCDKTVSKYFNFRLRLILIAALIEQRDLDGAEKLLDEIVCELKKDRFQPLHITAENYRAKIFLVRSHLETARANDYLAMARDLYLQNESLESELRKKNG
ncbi:protein kinase, partial [bacterium]|nr:protein kinase [bacterium]